MRWIALGLLAGAAALYMLATALEARHAAWGYVAAFSEAAMVGAIADWFAVVALFRHPLGLPIPHTAIIPSNKDRIGENLAAFICEHFLSTPQVLAKLNEFDAGARTARWLADARHAEQVAQHAGAALRYALGALDDERVRRFFRTTVLAELSRADVSTLGSQVLDVLTLDRRHHEVLDAVLRKLAVLLDKYLRFVGLDTVAGRYATAKMVAGIMRLVGEMAEDPAHPLRLQFDEVMASFVQRLKADPALRERVEAAKQDLLSSPTLTTYLQGVWTSMVEWMRGDLDQPESRLRARAAEAIRLLGERLQGDLGMQAWINEQLMAAAPRWIERYREDIRGYIVARVREWNAEEMTGELERNIGRDLQFIRVNGTVVGGLVGLGIYTVTQLMR
jgi:uncharacterized membrane-anchored protein YjiN (DUF445 family)